MACTLRKKRTGSSSRNTSGDIFWKSKATAEGDLKAIVQTIGKASGIITQDNSRCHPVGMDNQQQ